MLARRELSEAQLRERLSRRGHPAASIDDAVARLIGERSLDDERVAAAIARSETSTKGRGRRRVFQKIRAAGISSELAERAVADVFEDLDPEAMLQAALEKRLRGGRPIADEREFARLFRYLVDQGFDSDRVLSLLRSRRSVGPS